MKIHFKENGKIYCNLASYYSDTTEDWDKVTCNSCFRLKNSIVNKKKIADKFCIKNKEISAYEKRKDWKN